MVSVKKKIINGKWYLYAEYSFRLPNDCVKKVSKFIKNADEVNSQAIKAYFIEKEKVGYRRYALGKYFTDEVFTKELLESIEDIRVEYKHLKKKITRKQWDDIIDRFTINFTYESNSIEGNSLTLKDVTLILTENIVPKGKDLREIYETKNTRVANQLLFSNKIKLTHGSIIKLHRVIVNDTGVSIGYKKLPNFLLMRNVKTTPPENVENEMTSLLKWYEENKNKVHPLRLGAEFHARFERIHPFEDGNGRVGRILLNAILLESGLPPIIIRKTMRSAYFSALGAFDNKHKTSFERFVIEKFKKTFKDFFRLYIKYI
ncbi:Fic family protein [Candidatus Woesearchaeota archaeon]|nr:Fic family protein [Candidatus Woesearchaeota archaeon]